jgi:hypothetical protein
LSANCFGVVTSGPSRTRRRQASPPALSSTKPVAPPPRVSAPGLPVGFDDQQHPPAVPLRGSSSAPLPILLAWHAELLAAQRECAAVATTLEAAEARRHTAWAHYLELVGNRYEDDRQSPVSRAAGGPQTRGRDKGKARASPGDGDESAELGDEGKSIDEVDSGLRVQDDDLSGSMDLS